MQILLPDWISQGLTLASFISLTEQQKKRERGGKGYFLLICILASVSFCSVLIM